ncbi:uncharacterized protein [Typha latifolia]|uniref:uncharacterized protein n=1 Tax=Typha latifolia TaxID=4733 RepID=UPI003C306A7A
MTETSATKTIYPTPVAHRRRRRRRTICLIILAVLVAIAVLAVVLYFTLFRVRDPTIEPVSAVVTGIAPRLTFPAIQIQINVTLALVVRVYNPNRAAFSHGVGHTVLLYRGVQVGEADVEPGRIPNHGSGLVRLNLNLQADRFGNEMENLLADVAAGEVDLDALSTVAGRVTVLGFIKHHVVAKSTCHVAVGFPDLKVRSQECSTKAEL